jgi:hypothetical protein
MNVKLTIYSSPILMTIEFSRQSLEKYSNIKFLKNKIRPVGAQLHADRRTDMTKLTVALRNCAYVPKISEYGNVDGIHLALDKDQ